MAETILIANSDPSQLNLIDVILSSQDYDIVMLEDGRAVLEYLRDNTPDLAILDANLDTVGGLDVCNKMKRIKRLNNKPVIVVLETQQDIDNPETQQIAKLAKVDKLLCKPLGNQNLPKHVRDLLSNSNVASLPISRPPTMSGANSQSGSAPDVRALLGLSEGAVPAQDSNRPPTQPFIPAYEEPIKPVMEAPTMPPMYGGSPSMQPPISPQSPPIPASGDRGLEVRLKMLEAENKMLRQQIMELEQRLMSMQSAAQEAAVYLTQVEEGEDEEELASVRERAVNALTGVLGRFRKAPAKDS